MSEYKKHPDGSVTVGPVDTTERLIESLAEYAALRTGAGAAEECRRLAWFLGDKGEADAARAIMEHASVIDYTEEWKWTPWGYMPAPKVP